MPENIDSDAHMKRLRADFSPLQRRQRPQQKMWEENERSWPQSPSLQTWPSLDKKSDFNGWTPRPSREPCRCSPAWAAKVGEKRTRERDLCSQGREKRPCTEITSGHSTALVPYTGVSDHGRGGRFRPRRFLSQEDRDELLRYIALEPSIPRGISEKLPWEADEGSEVGTMVVYQPQHGFFDESQSICDDKLAMCEFDIDDVD